MSPGVSNYFSTAGTSHIRNWKWASTAGPVLRALSVTSSKKAARLRGPRRKDQGFNVLANRKPISTIR
jgi:hypothetical protein